VIVIKRVSDGGFGVISNYNIAGAESGTKCAVVAWRVTSLLRNACFFMMLAHRTRVV
jgi:hypothetical protein